MKGPGISSKKYWTAGVIAAASLCVVAIRLMFQGVPSPAGPEEPAGGFSAARALMDVAKIAAEIHPAGSAAHTRARGYLLNRLRETGLEISRQDTIAARTWFPNYHTAGTVHNLAARLRGTDSRGSVLIMAHYDSVDSGPGASDDAAAVAAMLEAVRVIKQGPRMKNDLIFLFTDGEEAGLLGATAFLRDHPWRSAVRFVINLEARGTRGASTLFETGRGNGRIIGDFIREDPHPTGNSLTNAIYSYLPNDTDFTVFREAGFQGLNFAFIGNAAAYHTMLDNANNVDPASLQHHGSHVLALARFYGNDSLEGLTGEDAVYFTIIGGFMVAYSGFLSLIFSILIVSFTLAVSARFIMKRKMKMKPALLGLGGNMVIIAAVPGAAFLLWKLVLFLHPGYAGMIMGDIYNREWYVAALILFSLLVYAVLFKTFLKKIRPVDLFVPGLAVWSLLLAASTAMMPGAAFIFQWPLLFAAVQLLFITGDAEDRKGRAPLFFVLSMPAILMVTDMLHGVYTGLTLGSGVIAASVVFSLFLLLFSPLMGEVIRDGASFVIALTGAVAVLSIAGGAVTGSIDNERPRQNSLVYAYDADASDAMWASCDHTTDRWTSQFFGGRETRGPLPAFFPITGKCLMRPYGFLIGKAPWIALNPPSARILKDRRDRTGRQRTVNARFTPGGNTMAMVLYIKDDNKKIAALSVDGQDLRRIDESVLKPGHRMMMKMVDLENWIVIRYQGLPADGILVSFTTDSGAPTEIRCVDIYGQLPDMQRMGYSERPSGMIPAPDFLLRDSTMVSRRFFL